MTREDAIAKNATKWWETATSQEIVMFQLYEERLCMPFPEFHTALEAALQRPVFTHELAEIDDIREEFERTLTKVSEK